MTNGTVQPYGMGPLVCLVLLSRVAAAQGAVEVISDDGSLVDATSGHTFARFSDAKPAVLRLTGPGRFHADLRVNLAGDSSPAPAPSPVVITVLADGKALASFRVQPRPGSDSWSGETGIRPSATTGFAIDVDPGPQPYEFRVRGAPPGGAALLVVASSSARRPLAADAPVVPTRSGKASTAAAGATPLAAVAANPPAAPNAGRPTTTAAPAGAVARGSELDLRRVSALGFGLEVASGVEGDSTTSPFLGYRLWWTDRFGAALRLGVASRKAATEVAGSPDGDPGSGESRLAGGTGHDVAVSGTAFWNVTRAENSALYLFGGGGMVMSKRLRRDAELGALGAAGLGMELSPPGLRSVGVTLEGGLRLLSFPSEDLGTRLDPTVTATFHYYLNRK